MATNPSRRPTLAANLLMSSKLSSKSVSEAKIQYKRGNTTLHAAASPCVKRGVADWCSDDAMMHGPPGVDVDNTLEMPKPVRCRTVRPALVPLPS